MSLPWWEFIVRGGVVYCALLLLVRVSISVGYLSSRSRKLATLIDGDCVLLGRDGRIFKEVLRRSRIAEKDVEQALREVDVELAKAKCIFLEADGKITVLEKKD
jgi:uncharacterized membrane protein YcaP (DUF421 family)